MRPPVSKFYILIVFLLINISLFSQEFELFDKIPDSLKNMNYKELDFNFYSINTAYKDKFIYANAYYLKSRLQKDSINMAQSFIYLVSFFDNSKVEEILDSLSWYGNKLKEPRFNGIASYYKGILNEEYQNFDLALDYYNESKKYTELVGDEETQFKIKKRIAWLKNDSSDYEEALPLFKEIYYYLKKLSSKDKKYQSQYFSAISNLSDSFSKNGKVDSASYYLKIGIKESLKYDAIDNYNYLLFSLGINEYLAGNYDSAINHLNNTVDFLSKINDKGNLGVNFSYTGKSYRRKEEFDKAALYFEKMDSVVQITKYMDFGTRSSYEFLIDYYKKRGEKDKQLEFIEKLLYNDSAFFDRSLALIKSINKKYDTPKLLNEKDQLITSLQKGKVRSNSWLILLGGSLTLALFLIFYYRKRNSVYKGRFEELMNQDQLKMNTKNDIENHITKNSIQGISEELAFKINNDLNEFINQKKFLDKTLTLQKLAKQLNTNTNYLSKVINRDKQKNFSNFINDLRIDHTVDQLKTNEKYKLYSINGIASEMGFNSTQSFSRCFYKRTGIYPSFFIKNLNTRQEKRKLILNQ